MLIWQAQSYAAQQIGPDVHMSHARLEQADRRMDRRGRGSRDRADVRRQRFDDPADTGRYAQVHTSKMLPMHNMMLSLLHRPSVHDSGSFQSCTYLQVFGATYFGTKDCQARGMASMQTQLQIIIACTIWVGNAPVGVSVA